MKNKNYKESSSEAEKEKNDEELLIRIKNDRDIFSKIYPVYEEMANFGKLLPLFIHLNVYRIYQRVIEYLTVIRAETHQIEIMEQEYQDKLKDNSSLDELGRYIHSCILYLSSLHFINYFRYQT